MASTRSAAPMLLAMVFALSLQPASAQTAAQTPAPTSAGTVDPALMQDLVVANRVLTDLNVIDGFGHVSMRHPTDPNRYLMGRSVAPALVTADDIMEYDLDSNPVDAKGRASFLERFIHGEIYKARPDVKAIVHTHSPGIIPFSVSSTPLRPVFHLGAFLFPDVPVFEIRDSAGMSNMLVSNTQLGKALASTLGDRSVALMRGHGSVVVASTIPMAVFRAHYSNVNAQLQSQALALGGSVSYLLGEESQKTLAVIDQIHGRAWDLWKRAALEKMAPK
ncbi:class II aldolase/adducin family protein [Tardiphaga sp. 1201_B9_N1_1]|jgi:ribulose-5-phosphate 4-epimerase/fuculose-1-phosphate aldolase|uniref:class II aldolase/adducin family protein n=1 Tax=unclassified Tardiphaga TaxID=2631404 RepID=UPI000FED4353|nr:class II aldolase/adducin family protein [Tardiphaga sp. 37S4]UFS74633.1 class II aldolase/adducin family protein [Tardiphaga sp. 37S4]